MWELSEKRFGADHLQRVQQRSEPWAFQRVDLWFPAGIFGLLAIFSAGDVATRVSLPLGGLVGLIGLASLALAARSFGQGLFVGSDGLVLRRVVRRSHVRWHPGLRFTIQRMFSAPGIAVLVIDDPDTGRHRVWWVHERNQPKELDLPLRSLCRDLQALNDQSVSPNR